MSWGINETASEIEKIKSESADYLNGLNSCGVIDWNTYNYAFDFYGNLLMKAYKQGEKDAQPEPCDDPRADVYYLAEKIGIHRLYTLVVELRGEPEPCEDAVSRQAIIKTLNEMDRYVSEELRLCDTDKKFPKNEVFIVDDVYEEIVEKLPPVTPKPDQYEDALKKIKNASFVGSDGLDYVETRQALDALKDAIGVTLHVAKISKHCSDFSDLDEVIECEDAVSRAEQPEIIHCRDCKHHWTHSCMDAFPGEICDLDQTFYDSNIDYCSLAERRADEGSD